MANTKVAEGGVSLEVGEDVAQGKYANLMVIAHSPSEFVMDFAAMLPGMNKPRVVSRVIVTPEHAKRLLYSLQENIARYESHNGIIEIPQRGEVLPPNLTPVGEA